MDRVTGKMRRRTALKAAACLAAAPMLPEAFVHAGAAECGAPPPVLPRSPPVLAQNYAARGVGGGGAFAGFSMSPYQDLWFVGTDMGPLFRSIDRGASWQTVPTEKALFFVTNLDGRDYTDLPAPGYSAIANTVFHAPEGGFPVVSTNGGIDWSAITDLESATVLFWRPDSTNAGTVYAGLTDGLAVTRDNGCKWHLIAKGMGKALGMFIDEADGKIYVAFADGIYQSSDGGSNLSKQITPPAPTVLHRFAGGRGDDGIVFVYVLDPSENLGNGAVYIGPPDPSKMRAAQILVAGALQPLTGCEHVAMAENDSVVYVTGSRGAPGESGTSIYKCTDGSKFSKVFCCADIGYGKNPWPTLSPSAVGLDIKYWDDGYFTFTVNQRSSAMVGGGEAAFLHLSTDGGQTWQSPFCHPLQTPPGPGQHWTSTGLENTSIRKLVFSQLDPKFGIACGCDRYVLITEDGGQTWRLSTDKGPDGRTEFPFKACYDAIFDPDDPNTIYVALSNVHDFQHPGNFGRILGPMLGGIFKTIDRGKSWQQLVGGDLAGTSSFVSVAFNIKENLLYGGTQGAGIVTVKRDGTGWAWSIAGLPVNAIVPQIQADPATGDMYALIGSDPTDDAANWQNSGLYWRQAGGQQWQSLRGTLIPPPSVKSLDSLMLYPTSFALVHGTDGAVQKLLVTTADRCAAPDRLAAAGLWQCVVEHSGPHTWNQIQQYSNAYSVDLDPKDPNRIYLSGMWYSGWGETYGALYSDDGSSFNTNCDLEIQTCLWSVTPDPNDPSMIFYACFGAGLRHGPKPSVNRCVKPPGS